MAGCKRRAFYKVTGGNGHNSVVRADALPAVQRLGKWCWRAIAMPDAGRLDSNGKVDQLREQREQLPSAMGHGLKAWWTVASQILSSYYSHTAPIIVFGVIHSDGWKMGPYPKELTF